MFYTSKELAEMFKVSPLTIKREYDRGKIHGFYVGNELRFSQQSVDDYSCIKSHHKTSRELELEKEVAELQTKLKEKDSVFIRLKNEVLKLA